MEWTSWRVEMRHGKWVAGGLAGTVLGGCVGLAALAQQPAAPAGATASVRVDVKAADGRNFGVATISVGTQARSSGVVVHLELKGLPPGWHGMHFHNKADCSAADLTSAGPHVHTVEPVVHGFLSANANDWGDLPNIYAAADGSVNADVFSPYVLLGAAGGDSRPALEDADGSALIIHASPDDYHTQPIGGAGARIACGLITG
jgi:Cu-Zn family superoxide dismutase